jgi:hypothetical protein
VWWNPSACYVDRAGPFKLKGYNMSSDIPMDPGSVRYDDPVIQAAWEQSCNVEYQTAEARRVDPMPDPENLTVGETIVFATFFASVSQHLLAMPEVRQQYNRRFIVLSKSPGWRAFEEWKDVKHHRKTPLEAAEELLALLWDRLGKPSKELRLMRLLDAVQLVDRPNAARAKTSTPRDQAKSVKCKGIYIGALVKGETPPTQAEIAKIVGCSPGVVSRAIGELERKRKGEAKRDASDRQNERSNRKEARNK